MKKFLSSVVALFLFGSFAATSGAFASTHEVAEFVQSEDKASVEPLGISEEERTRRELVCENAYDACCDQCKRHLGGSPCYSECMEKQAECKKQIPDRDE
jgi:hypothetical protein